MGRVPQVVVGRRARRSKLQGEEGAIAILDATLLLGKAAGQWPEHRGGKRGGAEDRDGACSSRWQTVQQAAHTQLRRRVQLLQGG